MALLSPRQVVLFVLADFPVAVYSSKASGQVSANCPGFVLLAVASELLLLDYVAVRE